MRSFLCVSTYVLVVAGLCVAAAAPAHAGGCSKLVGTADGWDKADALSGAQAALAGAVADFKKSKGAVTVTAMRAKPQPYWRESSLGRSLPQAGRGDVEVLYRLLAWRRVAGGLHFGRQGLLVS